MGKGDPEGGRPPIVLTEEQAIQVEALGAWLNQDQIADWLGITRPTFAAILERQPEVSLRYKKGLANAVAHVAQGVVQRARGGDNLCSLFYLKTKGGWSETVRVDNTSSDGSMSPIATLSGDDLDKELKRRGINPRLLDE